MFFDVFDFSKIICCRTVQLSIVPFQFRLAYARSTKYFRTTSTCRWRRNGTPCGTAPDRWPGNGDRCRVWRWRFHICKFARSYKSEWAVFENCLRDVIGYVSVDGRHTADSYQVGNSPVEITDVLQGYPESIACRYCRYFCHYTSTMRWSSLLRILRNCGAIQKPTESKFIRNVAVNRQNVSFAH